MLSSRSLFRTFRTSDKRSTSPSLAPTHYLSHHHLPRTTTEHHLLVLPEHPEDDLPPGGVSAPGTLADLTEASLLQQGAVAVLVGDAGGDATSAGGRTW